MNKKFVLAHVAAIYIAMIGVGNAAPPPFVVETDLSNPLAVETVEGNPLEVEVVNTSPTEVRIPAQGFLTCNIEVGDNLCLILMIKSDDAPDGTNTFVFESVATSHRVPTDATIQKAQYIVNVTYRGGFYSHRVTAANPFVPKAGSLENVEINTTQNTNFRLTLASVYPNSIIFFTIAGTNTTSRPLRQQISYTGYYTHDDTADLP